MQQPNKRGFVWTFLAEKLIAYVFSSSRSGETPSTILGASTETLVVDMYTGYNEVTSTGGRTRAACLPTKMPFLRLGPETSGDCSDTANTRSRGRSERAAMD